MDKAFAFYLILSLDDGAHISTLYSKTNEMTPLGDTNTNIFQAYLNLGKSHSNYSTSIYYLSSKLS